MRRISRLVLCVPALIVAAQIVPASAQDAATEAPAAAPAEKIKLATNLPLNKKLQVVVGIATESVGEQMGQEVRSAFGFDTTYDTAVVGVDSEAGTSDLEMVFKRINGSMDNPMMGAFAFDSADPEVGADNPMGAQIAASMAIYIDSKLTATVGADAGVAEVKGVDEVAEKVLAANPMAAMQGDPAESMRTDIANTFPRLPAEEVGVGSTWTGQRVLDFQGAKFELDVTYKVTEVSAESVSYTGEYTGKSSGGMMGGMIAFSDPSGSLAGRISRQHGLPLFEELTLSSSMDTSAMGGGQGKFSLTRTVKVGEPEASGDTPVTGGDSPEPETPQPDGE